MPKLTVQTGSRSGTELTFDRSVVVGRGPAADLSLDDPEVSRRHALLRWVDGECVVLDLGSANGTFVNGRRIARPTRLRDGDLLGLGKITARYCEPVSTPEAPALEATVVWQDPSRSQPQILLTMAAEESGVPPFDNQEAAGLVAAMSQRLRFLNDLAKVSGRAFDESALLSFVLDELFGLIPQINRAFIMLWDTRGGQLVPRAARTRSGGPSQMTASRTLLGDAVGRREAVLAVDVAADARYAAAESLYGLGVRSAICVPMVFDSQVHGVIQVDTASPGAPLGKGELALMVGVATQVGMVLAYAGLHARLVERELVERDMALARKIQRHFLPQELPAIGEYRFAVECSPAVSLGGDFYDRLELADGTIGLAVGDVSGKGVSAALYAAKLSSDLRYQAAGQAEPAQILERLNRSLVGGEEGMFVTLALIALDARHAGLRVASAGHPLPLVRDAANVVVELGRVGDVPLGISVEATFGQYSYELDRSDLVVLYTDGITEAMNGRKELFGTERLIDAIRRAPPSADGVVRAVIGAVRGFAGGEAQSDDITLLCCGREGTPLT